MCLLMNVRKVNYIQVIKRVVVTLLAAFALLCVLLYFLVRTANQAAYFDVKNSTSLPWKLYLYSVYPDNPVLIEEVVVDANSSVSLASQPDCGSMVMVEVRSGNQIFSSKPDEFCTGGLGLSFTSKITIHDHKDPTISKSDWNFRIG